MTKLDSKRDLYVPPVPAPRSARPWNSDRQLISQLRLDFISNLILKRHKIRLLGENLVLLLSISAIHQQRHAEQSFILSLQRSLKVDGNGAHLMSAGGAFGGARGYQPKPPEKGVFPLDHFGECKEVRFYSATGLRHICICLRVVLTAGKLFSF